jgi:hypothetical protein
VAGPLFHVSLVVYCRLQRGSPDAGENHQAPAHRGRSSDLADDDGPIFSTVNKLVDALRAVAHSRDLELREEACFWGRELLRGTKHEEGLTRALLTEGGPWPSSALSDLLGIASPTRAEGRNRALPDQLVDCSPVDSQQFADFLYRQDFIIEYHRVYEALCS